MRYLDRFEIAHIVGKTWNLGEQEFGLRVGGSLVKKSIAERVPKKVEKVVIPVVGRSRPSRGLLEAKQRRLERRMILAKMMSIREKKVSFSLRSGWSLGIIQQVKRRWKVQVLPMMKKRKGR